MTMTDENLEEIKRERDGLIIFVLQLIYSENATRNRVLNSFKLKKANRPAGRPRTHTPESDEGYLLAFESIKTEASKLAGRKLTDDEVLALPQLYLFKQNNHRLTRIISKESKGQRKTQRNRLAESRKSRKLLK